MGLIFTLNYFTLCCKLHGVDTEVKLYIVQKIHFFWTTSFSTGINKTIKHDSHIGDLCADINSSVTYACKLI